MIRNFQIVYDRYYLFISIFKSATNYHKFNLNSKSLGSESSLLKKLFKKTLKPHINLYKATYKFNFCHWKAKCWEPEAGNYLTLSQWNCRISKKFAHLIPTQIPRPLQISTSRIIASHQHSWKFGRRWAKKTYKIH